MSQVPAPFLLQHPQVCCCPASWPCIHAAAVLWLPLARAPALFSWSLFSAAVSVQCLHSSGKRRSSCASLAALLTWKHLSPSVLLLPGLLSLSSLSSPRDLREQSKPCESPQPPSAGGSGSTAAACFAAQLPFPKSEVAEAKRW